MSLKAPMQITVKRPEMMETTALGAAYAAAVGIGWCDGAEVFGQGVEGSVEHHTFQPQLEGATCKRKYEHWKSAVHRSFDLAAIVDD